MCFIGEVRVEIPLATEKKTLAEIKAKVRVLLFISSHGMSGVKHSLSRAEPKSGVREDVSATMVEERP